MIELRPTGGCNPTHVAVGETVVQVNDRRYWLFVAVDPDTDRLLHVRLFPAMTTALTELFPAELRQKRLFDDAIFFIDSVPWLQAARHHHLLRFQHVTNGNRRAVERTFKQFKPEQKPSKPASDRLTRTAETWFRQSPSVSISQSVQYLTYVLHLFRLFPISRRIDTVFYLIRSRSDRCR